MKIQKKELKDNNCKCLCMFWIKFR